MPSGDLHRALILCLAAATPARVAGTPRAVTGRPGVPGLQIHIDTEIRNECQMFAHLFID
jgi:hypothetical protein